MMINFLLLILIWLISMWFSSRNMFWKSIEILMVTWLVIGSGIAFGGLLKMFTLWFIGVWI